MTRLLVTLVPFAALALAGALAAQDKKGAESLEGKWEVTAQTVDGKMSEPEELKNVFAVVKGEKVTFLYKDKERGTATQKLDPKKSPKQVDVTYEDGPLKGTTLKGIYKLEGDTLTICLGGLGKDRPTEFASKDGSGTILITNKRAK